jgi:hypothetical protein
MRAVLLVGGFLGAYIFWPYLAVDERLAWAAMLPAAYFAGMWALLKP